MSSVEHTTPLWVTFSSLAWHTDPAKVPGEQPSPELLERWLRLRGLELVDRQRARRILSRLVPVVRWPGETLTHAWRKVFGEDPPDLGAAEREALESWDGGDAVYYRYPRGQILVIHNDGGIGISQEASTNDEGEGT